MGEAGNKLVISTTQGDGTIIYVQHNKMCIQKVTSLYNGISDWQDKILLCENYIFFSKLNIITLLVMTSILLEALLPTGLYPVPLP